MDPILSGLTTKLLYDVLARGVGVATADSVEDRVTRAAETVADEHGEFDPEHLVDALTDDTVGECVEQFERGEPLRVTEITDAFREQAAAKHVDARPGTDTETVVREFVRELQRELAHEPAVWRAMALREIKRGTRDTERVAAAVEELREELDEATVVDVDALATAVEHTQAQGFEWVTPHDFEEGRVDDDYCWRRSFTLGEAWEGYPLERERPLAGETDERQDLTEQLLDTLADGGGAALLGAPGSGKTTATRTAMAEWVRRHDDGTVLYRRHGVQQPVDAEQLTDVVETAREEGPVLIAVEDAARRGTYPVFETAGTFEAAEDVSVLVNARENEWRDSDEGMRDSLGDLSQAAADVRRVQSECFDLVDMPPFDAREVERFVENYERVTGRAASLGDDSDAILSQIRGHSGISPMLLLAYHVPVWTDEVDARTDTDVPALVENVREVFRFAHGEAEEMPLDTDDGDETALVAKLALTVNVLNAAELSVRREFLLGFGEELEELVRIDELLSQLQGPLLFGREGQRYRTHHPLWSRLYLSEHLEQASSPAKARLEFGQCVNEVFALLDSAERRAVVSDFVGETEPLSSMEEAPERLADELVSEVFDIGIGRPELTPLFGTSNSTQINLPSVCSPETPVRVAFGRAKMYGKIGDRDHQIGEIEVARERHEDSGLDPDAFFAEYHTQLGHHAFNTGEFDDAQSHYQRAYRHAPSVESNLNEAKTLGNIGSVAQNLGEYERAYSCLKESLKIFRDISDPGGEGKSLNNLGSVAQSLGEYERARERHRESLEIFREIGDRGSEAKSLNNLGLVARNLGEYDRAKERYEESLEIFREIGDRASEAKTVNNLGSVARDIGEYEQARKHHKESLAIEREIGNRSGEASSLNNLGLVAGNLGEHERAKERYKQSLTICREVGDRGSEAKALGNLGVVAGNLGKYEQAREFYKQGLRIEREIGDRSAEAKSLNNLGLIAEKTEEYERAREHYKESLEIEHEIGNRAGEATSFTNLGSVQAKQGNYQAAIENCGDAAHVFRDIGAIRRALIALSNLSKAASMASETETALDACHEALELIEQSDLDGLDDHAREFRRRAARLDDRSRYTLEGDPDDATPRECYRDALVRINSGDADPDTVLVRLQRAWTAREHHDTGTDAHAAATAAGVALAAYHDLLSPAQTPDDLDRETILSTVDPSAAVYSDAVRAVYDHLVGDDPAHTPEELEARVDTPVGDDTTALETLVFARLLRALTE